MCGVEILDLPCLASGNNLNLTSDDMDDLRRQGIDVDDYNYPAPENIPVPKINPLPQLEEDKNWSSEGIICPRKSNNLHNTYADFNNYSCEEVMKMNKYELFLILFPFDYLK